ncbi:MAG: hypothetical protein QF886_23820, partial [Planctomycetota bacterium]|nr:hypothetical protein [Planctomycetota bacterium]
MNTERAEELHSQKIDGPLSAEEEAELEALMKDADCRREAAGLDRASELVQSLPRMKAPPELAGAIQQQIREQGSPNISQPNWVLGWIAAGIAALLAIVLLASRDPAGSSNEPELAGHEKKNSATGSKSKGQDEDSISQPGEDPDN